MGNAWGEVQTNSAPSFAVGANFISNYDNCQWKTQNVTVSDNTISFDPSTLPDVMASGATDTCA